jgi:hypothetical protein
MIGRGFSRDLISERFERGFSRELGLDRGDSRDFSLSIPRKAMSKEDPTSILKKPSASITISENNPENETTNFNGPAALEQRLGDTPLQNRSKKLKFIQFQGDFSLQRQYTNQQSNKNSKDNSSINESSKKGEDELDIPFRLVKINSNIDESLL